MPCLKYVVEWENHWNFFFFFNDQDLIFYVIEITNLHSYWKDLIYIYMDVTLACLQNLRALPYEPIKLW